MQNQTQLKLEDTKYYANPFITMIQTVPQASIILSEVPAFIFAIDNGDFYKVYRYFPNLVIPRRILEIGIIQKEGVIYVSKN